MSDNPLQKLARLAGGILLMQGRLGHQVLGQMLIIGPTPLEIAAASVVLTATNGQQNAVAQAAVRTLAPAVALYAVQRAQEKRLTALLELAQRKEDAARDRRVVEAEYERQRELAEQEIAALKERLSRCQQELQARTQAQADLVPRAPAEPNQERSGHQLPPPTPAKKGKRHKPRGGKP